MELESLCVSNGPRTRCYGHTNLNTTAIYVQVSDPKRVEAIDRLDPFQEFPC